MKLALYLEQHRISQEAFGREIGLSQGQVSRMVQGTTNVPLAVMKRVFEKTRGAVTPNDFLDAAPQQPETGAAA